MGDEATSEALTFDRWQERANVWVRRNFPNSGASEQFLGIVEEMGEYAVASAARYRAIQDGDDDAKYDAEAELSDAIGDICIYLANYCNFRDIEISDWVRKAGLGNGTISDFQAFVYLDREPGLPNFPAHDLVRFLGSLAHSQLKTRQGIRGSEAKHRAAEINSVVEMFVTLAHICNQLDLALSDIIAKTSDHVFARDWIANPQNGESPCPKPL